MDRVEEWAPALTERDAELDFCRASRILRDGRLSSLPLSPREIDLLLADHFRLSVDGTLGASALALTPVLGASRD